MNKKIVAYFTCCGKYMVIVKLEHGTHVMDLREWEWMNKKQHSKHWNKNKRRKAA